MAPLIALTIYYGVRPGPVLDASRPPPITDQGLPVGPRGDQDRCVIAHEGIGYDVLPFAPALPEIILAWAALGLVMRARSRATPRPSHRRLSVGASDRRIRLVFSSAASTATAFEGPSSPTASRLMKLLTWQGRSRRCSCRSNGSNATGCSVRIFIARAAGDARHDDDDIGQRSDSVYLGLELQSLALYVVAAIHRDNSKGDGGRASNISFWARFPRACCSMARRWSTASPARRPSLRRRGGKGGASIGWSWG